MKYLMIITTLIFTTLSAFSAGANAATIEKMVTLKTATGSLEGTLLIAEQSDPKYVALIIAGSGPTDRDGNNPQMKNNSLKMLAQSLAKQGISTLRYDKRGIASSKNAGLKEHILRFDDYINDAKGWIDYLDNLDDFKQIIVIGHSEGSLLGMVASQQQNVDKFISIAGAGQPIDQIIRKQLQAQPAVVLEQSTPILDKLLQGMTVKHVPSYLNSLFRPSIQPYMISWFKYDPQREIAKLHKPVLIIQGATDVQVSVSDANRLFAANKTAKKVIIEKMNHIFKPASLNRNENFKTYNQPNLPIQPELVEAITSFIYNQ